MSFMGSPLVLGPTVGDLQVSSKSRKKGQVCAPGSF